MAIVGWSPALPVAISLIVAVGFRISRRPWRSTFVGAAQGLLWPSLMLSFFLVPKAP